jgi:hypothetical protein
LTNFEKISDKNHDSFQRFSTRDNEIESDFLKTGSGPATPASDVQKGEGLVETIQMSPVHQDKNEKMIAQKKLNVSNNENLAIV